MSVSTYGKIKGFVRWEEVLNYIKQKYDSTAKSDISRSNAMPLTECHFNYTVNPHSEDETMYYYDCGFIFFKLNGERRQLFYYYSNINTLESLEEYEQNGLYDSVEMEKSEVTTISLGHFGDSVEVITDIITHFGGGWIDKNDCDDEAYCPIIPNPDGSIKPVKYVTMDEVYEKFGCVVVIKRKR